MVLFFHCRGQLAMGHSLYSIICMDLPAHAHLYFRVLGIAAQETKQQRKTELGEDGLMGGRLDEVILEGEVEGSGASSRKH